MKHCNGCGRDLPDTKFSKNKGHRDGLNSRCKECVAAYYVNNAERIKAKQAAYYANPERKAYQAAYYAKPEVRERVAANRLAAVVSDTEEWCDDDVGEYLAAVGFVGGMIDEDM